ncbi:hypothetical protein PV689_19300 [Streptomyces sp. ATCC51928]|uniref:DUF2267 domain-containing protein n=1 Tax=Streptomyces caviscabies TaxID=90079 RepID=A0ABW2MLQ0_9ACTN|nr:MULTISPECIES: DUF2267 domain-containing protein [unclassified Streptomyces]MDX3504063.1 hypothetical protein [Streptomyces sp. ATCC51928]MDX5524890.1 hypothetical protein [Streptomyces sp. DE06-01C]
MRLRWESFLDRVRERGEYGTRTEAERAARVVLALLGAHLVGRERAEPAAVLSVAADAAGEELTRRILLQLPPDYDVFFGGRASDT